MVFSKLYICLAHAVVIVANLENINSIAARHWELFAGQNYFDAHGVFVGALLGAPLLFVMMVILVHTFTYSTSRLNVLYPRLSMLYLSIEYALPLGVVCLASEDTLLV